MGGGARAGPPRASGFRFDPQPPACAAAQPKSGDRQQPSARAAAKPRPGTFQQPTAPAAAKPDKPGKPHQLTPNPADPQRYVAHMGAIRGIQDYLGRKAEKAALPRVENSNVDRSVGAIALTVMG